MSILINPIIFENQDYNEVWKPLIHDGINSNEYIISNFGNIYDLKNCIYVVQRIGNNGYIYVSLRHNSSLTYGNIDLLQKILLQRKIKIKFKLII